MTDVHFLYHRKTNLVPTALRDVTSNDLKDAYIVANVDAIYRRVNCAMLQRKHHVTVDLPKFTINAGNFIEMCHQKRRKN